jgi:hypothetical protein
LENESYICTPVTVISTTASFPAVIEIDLYLTPLQLIEAEPLPPCLTEKRKKTKREVWEAIVDPDLTLQLRPTK